MAEHKELLNELKTLIGGIKNDNAVLAIANNLDDLDSLTENDKNMLLAYYILDSIDRHPEDVEEVEIENLYTKDEIELHNTAHENEKYLMTCIN